MSSRLNSVSSRLSSSSSSSGFSSIEGQLELKRSAFHPTFANHYGFGRSGTGLRPATSIDSDKTEIITRRMSEEGHSTVSSSDSSDDHKKKSVSVDYGVMEGQNGQEQNDKICQKNQEEEQNLR